MPCNASILKCSENNFKQYVFIVSSYLKEEACGLLNV